MATWRDQFSTFMSTWSASSDEEEDGGASSGEEEAEEDAGAEDAGPRQADASLCAGGAPGVRPATVRPLRAVVPSPHRARGPPPCASGNPELRALPRRLV